MFAIDVDTGYADVHIVHAYRLNFLEVAPALETNQNTLNMQRIYVNLSHCRDPAKMSIRLQFPQCRRPHGASYLEKALAELDAQFVEQDVEQK